MRLTVGLLEREVGWTRVLEQIGVASEHVADLSTISPDTHSAIIVNRTLDDIALKAIERYGEMGGSIIDTGGLVQRLDPRALRSRWFGTIYPEQGDAAFATVGLTDIELRLRVHREAKQMSGLLAVLPIGKGAIYHLPLPLDRLLLDTQARRRSFPAPTPRPPNERVSRIAKGEIRRIVDAVLRMAHFKAGLPYLHRRTLPGDVQGVLCYRIDSDSGSREQILGLHETARERKTRLTWFLHTEAHEGWLDLFASFEGDEVQLHGYRHATYDTLEENLVNQREAEEMLRKAGVKPTALAAPYGIWNPAVGQTISQLGLDYSSEFALDYNDLPFHPVVDARATHALQLPIHPICIGSLMIAHATPEAMKLYFRSVIDRTRALREPALLYHHPTHAHLDVMGDSLSYAQSTGLESWTMGELARWWRARERTSYTAHYNDGVLGIEPHSVDSESVTLEVERAGEHSIVPLNSALQVSLDDLHWSISTAPSRDEIDPTALRKPSLHRAVRTIEHSIYRTRT